MYIKEIKMRQIETAQQTFVLMKTSSRRLDQDEYVRLSLTSSEDVLVKTNIFVLAIRLQDVLQKGLQDIFKTSSKRLQDVLKNVFKTSSRRIGRRKIVTLKTCWRRLQDIFKTFSKRLQDVLQKRFQDVFKTSSRRLQDLLQRYFQDVFKTYY